MNSRLAYILVALFAAVSLRAACVPTLTVSPRDADGFITVTAQVDQQCYPKDVGVSLDGQSVNYSHCNYTGVCSFTTQIPTSCWASNSVHTLQAWATCGHWYGYSLCSTPYESGVSGEVSLSYNNTPEVSLSMTPPDATWTSTATITAHFQTNPFEQRQYLRLIRNGDINNVEDELANIPAADHTWTFPVNLACRPGPLRFQAVAMTCGHVPSDPSHIGWSGEIVLDPEVTPSASLVIPDPGPTGETTATAQAEFPFRLDDRRYLRIFRNGNIYDVVDELVVPNNQMSATLSTALNFACIAGSTTYRAAAMVCGDWYGSIYGNRVPSNPEFIGLSSPVEMRDEADPDVSLSYATDANGVDIATVTYAFYSTSSMQQRDLALYVDGALADTRSVAETSGTYTISLPSCWHEARAVATACDQGSNPAFTDEATVQSPQRKPLAELTLVKIPNAQPGEPTRRVNAHYDVRRATGRVVIRLLPWISADGEEDEGSILKDLSIPAALSSDYISIDLPLRPDQQARVRMTVEGCEIATVDLAIDCAPCDGAASKNPVYYTDGNMRLSDTDPLPPIKGHALTRVYNSDEQVVALFGRGWTTLFDQRLMAEPEIVSVTTITNEVVTFSLVAGVWRQTWPTARPARGSLSYNGTAGTYTYRPPGSLELSVFRASDGKLVALRNVGTGHEAQISYDANGLPQTITDSWTGVAWILTIAQRRVTSIAIAGRPDLTWTYQYDNDGNLMTVLAPGSATWRTYEYVANRMTASRDALGNLIESHTYDAQGWAIDSTGDVDEIASIQYDLPGSTPEERVTRVTFRTGAIADYALRPSGGSLRVVRVTGGCASCGSGEGTYVRDDEGRVIREQHADGYVTTRTYVADTLAAEQRYLRPSGCDPQIDVNQCRIGPDALAVATLVATPATITTAYEHTDPVWPDKVTAMQTPSVLSANGVRREELALHPILGVATSTSSSGWTGTTPAQETRVTANQWYGDVPPCDAQGNGCTPADAFVPTFNPGGSFQTAWLSLSQPAGLARSTDGPRATAADVTSYVHYPIDASAPALLRGRLAAVKNAAGHIVHYESYDLFGNVTRVVDPNGVATELTYDPLGRVATSTIKGIAGCGTNVDPLCATDLTTTRTYSPPAGPVQSEQRPGGGVTLYAYDARGRVATVSRGPSANDLRERIETSYDPLTGKKALERRLAFESGAWVEKTRQSFVYDAEARLQTTTHADGAALHYAYDAADRIASVRDENHASPNTVYAYDPAGRLSSVTQTLSTAPGGTIVTSYAYDVQGNLVTVADPNTNVTSYGIDDFGQMLSQQSPVTGTSAYDYGLGGELLTITDANGAATTRVYDALGRPLSATSSRAATPTETVQWQYDDATAGRFGIGRLAQMTDPTGATTYFYERRGLLRREERAFTGLAESYVTTFGHDADGNRSSIGYPSGTSVVYSADFAGRQVAASASGPGGAATLVSSATYLPFGPAASIAFGNSTTQTMTYDNRYRFMQNKLAATSTIAQYDYGYDPAGNITSIGDALDAGYDRTFAYDDLNRLVTANTGANLWRTGSYSYDAMGNMLSLRLGEVIRPPEPGDQSRLRPRSDVSTLPLGRVTTFAYSGTTPKLATVTNNDLERPVTYDAAGNETAYAILRTYSARNLLSPVIEPLEGITHRIDYGYDGRGLRVRRSEPPAAGGNSTRYFIYSPELQLLSVTNDDSPNPWLRGPRVNAASPSIRTEILWFGGRPIAQVTGGTTLAYTFTDHLGTPILQTSSGPTPVTWRAEHEPFGNVYEMRAGNRTDQPLRLPGQEVAMTLEGQEENYNIFRWYRAGWGRYTQSDPFAQPKWWEPNVFAYVRQNPLLSSDPLGLYTVDRSCYTCGPPNFGRVGADVTRMCQNTQRPACRQITRALSLVPAANRGQSEPLDSCLSRRCASSEVTVQCAVNTAPPRDPLHGACGQVSHRDGTITLLRGNSTTYQGPGTRACPFERGMSWVPTLFEEAVHGCGLWQEPYNNDQFSAIFRKLMEKCADYGPENY